MKRIHRKICAAARLLASMALFAPILGNADDAIGDDIDERYIGAPIDRIDIKRENIFDLDNPKEDYKLYRLINRLHIVTRENTVAKQLLFKEGQPFDPRLIEESERILRRNKYLYDVALSAKPNADGNVDVTVVTKDVWTLMPNLEITREGGETESSIGIEESNLFGYGQNVMITHRDDVDRRSNTFAYSDRQVASSWVSVSLRLADNSDGHSRSLNIVKPFHALNARRAAGFSLFDDDRRSAFYVLGDEAAEYRQEREFYSAFVGFSNGLDRGWVRRWSLGFVHDDNDFSEVLEPTLPQVVPTDRKLIYPYIGLELLEDEFQKSSNANQIERSEDFYVGTRLSATLGWADTSIGADRNALIYSLRANQSYGSLTDRALLLSASVTGRQEGGDTANAGTRLTARYYSRQSEKRLFFILLDVLGGHNRDLDNTVEIGGDSGLRGYPLRYQSGDSRMLVTIEQRYFTDWYPFQLFRIGGAVFVDAGRTWGDDPLDGPNLGWLKDIGFGLRFAPTRISTRKMVHLDIAFPLDGDPTIDDVQISFEAKRSF